MVKDLTCRGERESGREEGELRRRRGKEIEGRRSDGRTDLEGESGRVEGDLTYR